MKMRDGYSVLSHSCCASAAPILQSTIFFRLRCSMSTKIRMLLPSNRRRCTKKIF